VSQTEIDPMKSALSLMLALVTTTALAEPLPVPKPSGPGSCPHGYLASGSFCTPLGAADTIRPIHRGYRDWLAEAGFSDICMQYGAAAGGASIVVAPEKD